MVDQFTKWVEIHALPDVTAISTAKCAVDQFFSRFGTPLQIHTDQGGNFDGNVMKALCHLYHIAKTCTTPYQPSLNGQVEWYNRLLLQLVRCSRHAKQKTWDQDLQILAGAIHSMEHRATGYSANMMMLGMEVFQPIDILMRTAGEHFRDENPAGYVQHLRQVLQDVHRMASQKLRTQLNYQKRQYDLRLEENHYEVGDFVYRLNGASKVGESKKLKPIWIGPLVVINVINPVLFRVKDWKSEYVLHHDHLKLCEDRVIPLWLRRMRHNMLDLDTTIAYDEAEQEEEVPSSTPLSPSVGPLSAPEESRDLLDNSISKPESVTPPSCQSIDASTIGEGDSPSTTIGEGDSPSATLGEGDNQEPGPPSSQPFVSSFADTKVKEATNLFLGEGELGLDKLFKETVHVHAQKPQVPQGSSKIKMDKKGSQSPKVKKRESSPAETVSRTGRRRKISSYLQDYLV